MSDMKTLTEMLSTPAPCELGFSNCEGAAITRDTHPTGDALGEKGWPEVWFCGNCGWEAARES